MHSNELTRAPSIQNMNYDSSADIENRRCGGLGGTARQLSAQLLHKSITQNILSRCNAIESERVTGVRPQTRLNLGSFIVENGIKNPGGLSVRQENLCVWGMLEHITSNKNQTLSFDQLNSFAPTPEQINIAVKMVHQLRLTGDRFTA
jgi:hypothetical protein